MINELFTLSRALEDFGIVTKDWHNDYKQLPKVTKNAPCLRIWLNSDGSVYGIESLEGEMVQSLRKYGNNQGTFPALNIAPLYRIVEDTQIKKLDEIDKDISKLDFEDLQSWCIDDNWQRLISKINYCFIKVSKNLIELIDGQYCEATKAIKQLEEAVNRSNNPAQRFRFSLEEYVFQKLKKNEDARLLLPLLFHKGNKDVKDPRKDTGTISVILDIKNWKQYDYPIASKFMTEQINELLMDSERSSVSLKVINDQVDAFGHPYNHIDDPMPNVRVKGFDVTLRTMFAEQRSQFRYKTIASSSFLLSKENRALIKRSLEFIASREKEGINWRNIDKDEIVFVYPSKLPDVPIKFVAVFGTGAEINPKNVEDRFEKISEEFIKSLDAIPFNKKPDFIYIFSIKKIDKGRTKVMFTRNYTADNFIQATKEWSKGCQNVPGTRFGNEIIPFPLQTSRLINRVWKQNGMLAGSVQRLKYHQGLELLLDPPRNNQINEYLHTLLTNSFGLLKYVGNWDHGGSAYPKKLSEKKQQENEVTLLLIMIGLFLYKLGNRKENYMEELAFLFGQFLKISDELHALYCNVKREGDIPPQLVGNSLFVAASDNPNQTIAILSVRMNPYIAWAKQYRTKSEDEKGKESWKAGWYLSLYENIANKLSSELTEHVRFNDYEKAKFFIGYLASFPKKEKEDDIK